MKNTLKIGILRETKNPPDKRVPLIPSQIVQLQEQYPNVQFIVQPSKNRCFTDKEYANLGISIEEDLRTCKVLMGVKEVERSTLLSEKTYMFFAHVAKEQSYNQDLLKNIIQKKIKLIDYEYLTQENGARVVAFGRWAGIVGAYNGLRAWGIKHKTFDLKPSFLCHDLKEVRSWLNKIELANIKILVTGDGRVGNGAMEAIKQTYIENVSVDEFLNMKFDKPVVCQLSPSDYVRHKKGKSFDLHHFFKHPSEYESTFERFFHVADLYIAAHFWDSHSPIFINSDDFKSDKFKSDKFNISVIADISCDINGPIASTLRATSISEPFYDYNTLSESEEAPFTNPKNITVMAVDNLPGELPRDASTDFGEQLCKNVLPWFILNKKNGIIERATICDGGKLTSKFAYLKNYVES